MSLISTPQSAAAFFLLTFVSEDLATFGAATLAATGKISVIWSFWACFLGIWIGDAGLYALARWGTSKLAMKVGSKRLSQTRFANAAQFMNRWGSLTLAIARFIPGARLPTYLAAGILKVPFGSFLGVTALMALLWTAAIFGLNAWAWENISNPYLALCILSGFALLIYRQKLATRAKAFLGRISRWEFWPAWLFYIPVVIYNFILMARYRSLTLAALSNPGIEYGGLAGESKFVTQEILWKNFPTFSARVWLSKGEIQSRKLEIRSWIANRDLSFPFVMKPDIGQRGVGVKFIHSQEQADQYIEHCPHPLLVQAYAPGPCEAGVFYYRLPGTEKGKILAITKKIFPEVTGNGFNTLGELVEKDGRAALIKEVYQKRFPTKWNDILSAGETFRLVQSGNHAQGCIFEDGMNLFSGNLLDQVDRIAKSVPGFFIGRFDVRYESEEKLRKGESFTIVELNGAASEATSVYDSKNSLIQAYRLLFKQWGLVYKIADENRKTSPSVSCREIIHGWFEFRRRLASYPLAD